MNDDLARKYARVRQMLRLERPDRIPFVGRDLGFIEYRKEVYHLGEPEFVAMDGEVVVSRDGKRRYTRDGGVWAVGDEEKYKTDADVLNEDPMTFEVEEVGPTMLGEMAQLYAAKANSFYPAPWHYGTLVTRCVLVFGWEPFLLACAVDSAKLGKLMDRFGAASLAVAQGWAQTPGVEFIVIHDDIAGTRGPFMRPQWYRDYVFPLHKAIYDAIHAQGKKVLYVSDGNYLPLMDDVLATGTDGLYVESSSMDPAEVMRRGGKDKLYMVKTDNRAVDFGTPDDIRREVEKLRRLHEEYPGIMMYRGGGNPPPGNAEAFEQAYNELLVYA